MTFGGNIFQQFEVKNIRGIVYNAKGHKVRKLWRVPQDDGLKVESVFKLFLEIWEWTSRV